MTVSSPHEGSLCRIGDLPDTSYIIDIVLSDGSNHSLEFDQRAFDFSRRLFAYLDTESTGFVDQHVVESFVTIRCPVFWKRDEDIRKASPNDTHESTFREIWNAVRDCCVKPVSKKNQCKLGLEAWMVFSRFIALAQFYEAKRRFSATHLQQTMRHRNSPRGSELVMVDVPPQEPPTRLTPEALAKHEQQTERPLPLPELDLDHSLLAAHDASRNGVVRQPGHVKIALFGSPSHAIHTSQTHHPLEFTVTYAPPGSTHTPEETIVVRRSIKDMQWLHETFADHTKLGGTLCGRILPPFPVERNILTGSISKDDTMLNTSIKSTSGAIKSAVKGVGKIRDVAKSFIGSYIQQADGVEAEETTVVRRPSSSSKGKRISMPSNYYNPELPLGKARHIERYLNYLLEHPALEASFPLNAILKASQSGLEAAKDSLEECRRVKKDIEAEAPRLQDGVISHGSPSNFTWVRTAAQAAMALRIHGMLETTGMQSASAMLQHASLPTFDNRASGWDNEDYTSTVSAVSSAAPKSQQAENDFESGVVSVRSELASEEAGDSDDGYDMLPLPVPAPERRILNAGSGIQASETVDGSDRFHYGTGVVEGQLVDPDFDETFSVFLGDVNVDENIDKLREVIGSVDNTLSRCLASSGSIGKAHRERQEMHLGIVRDLDSWGGMRGKFVSQRSLLKGLDGIEHSKDVYEESDLALVDDLSWQTSLANAAVSAAESVRSAVRISKTAANARASASSAAMAAQNACSQEFVTMEEARAAQTRASIAKSHALRAAVVEHEAKTVKRRATLALANDVKCWNIHRKREMLLSCMNYARSQHEATRRAVDAWSSLRDGFIGSNALPKFEKRAIHRPQVSRPSEEEVTAKLFEDLFSQDERPAIVPVEHDLFAPPPIGEVKAEYDESSPPLAFADPLPNERSQSMSSLKDNVGGSEDVMTASMQSLVDGLMNWGGAFEEEDHFALPAGMAASIAFESSSKLA